MAKKRNDTEHDMANKAFKFRLYPNQEQEVLLSKTFGCVRFVYNRWLDRKIKQYEEDKTTVTYTMCAGEMAELKNEEGYTFLKEVDSIALQQALRHLDTAFQNFFKKSNRNSYSTVCVNGNINIADGFLKLPKIGRVKVKMHRVIPEGYILPAYYMRMN